MVEAGLGKSEKVKPAKMKPETTAANRKRAVLSNKPKKPGKGAGKINLAYKGATHSIGPGTSDRKLRKGNKRAAYKVESDVEDDVMTNEPASKADSLKGS